MVRPTTKPAPKKATPKSDTLPVTISKDKSLDRAPAEVVMAGLAGNAYATVKYGANSFGEVSLAEAIKVVKDTAKEVSSGAMAQAPTSHKGLRYSVAGLGLALVGDRCSWRRPGRCTYRTGHKAVGQPETDFGEATGNRTSNCPSLALTT
jgi:hypothetical protein